MEDAISQEAAAHGMEQGQEVAMNPEGLAWSGVTGTASQPQLFRLRSLWSKSGETVAHLKNCRHRFCLECEELGRVLLGNKTGGPGHGELYRLSPEHSTLSIKQRGPSSVLLFGDHPSETCRECYERAVWCALGWPQGDSG